MATWAKIKMFWETMIGATGSNFWATSTASGYAASYLYNMLETNSWKAASSTGPVYLVYDAGAGNTKTADYLAVIGHNLATAGATVVLQYTSLAATGDGAYLGNGSILGDGAGAYTDAFTPLVPADGKAFMKEFTAPAGKRYWRLKITGATAAPYMTLCVWGNKTELDYASAAFDPYEEEVKATVNLSQGGYVTGIHRQYSERSMSLRFDDADSALYAKIKAWWDGSGLNNFFLAWETANSPTDVFLMRPDAKFSNPLKAGGLYRDITLNLKGRKE